MGRVTGFAIVLDIGSPVDPDEDPGRRSCDWPERARDRTKWRKIKDVTFAICLSSQMHDNSVNYQHNDSKQK